MLKEFPAPFLFIFSDHFAGPYLSFMEKFEMGKISICECEIFPLFDTDFFCQFVYILDSGAVRVQVSKKYAHQRSFFSNFQLLAISSFDMIEKMGSCQSQTPNWIPIHFLFSSLLIWFTIYHWPHPAPTALPNPGTDSSALPVA